MANTTFIVAPSDGGYSASLQIPTLAAAKNIVFPANGGNLVATGASGELTGPVLINAVGGGTPAVLTNNGLMVYGTSAAAGYVQLGVQNLTSTGSSDLVVTKDTGNDSGGYVSVGINNSAYSSATWTINGAGDGYVSAVGGSLAVGCDVAGKSLIFYTGGQLISYAQMKLTDTYIVRYMATLPLGLNGTMWSKVTPTTLASWTTAATCIGAASTGIAPDGGTPTLTLPANFFIAGRVVRVKLRGTYTTGLAAPTYRVSCLLGAVTVADTGARSAGQTSSTYGFVIEIELTCKQTGNTATVIGNIMYLFTNNTAPGWVTSTNTTASNVDTAATQTIDVQVACGTNNASNTFTVSHCTIEVLC
jgi:hypothetical protein